MQKDMDVATILRVLLAGCQLALLVLVYLGVRSLHRSLLDLKARSSADIKGHTPLHNDIVTTTARSAEQLRPRVPLGGSVREEALRQHVEQFMESLTPTEREKVQQFRKELRRRVSEEKWCDDQEVSTKWWDDELIAYRFCSARKTVAEAIDMLAAHLQWRQNVGLDLVVVGNETGGDTSSSSRTVLPRLLAELRVPAAELAALRRARQFTYHKTDRDGRPMFYDRIGRMDLATLLKATTIDQLVQHFIWHQEATLVYRLPACSLQHGALIHTSIFVLDLDGFSLSTFSSEVHQLLKRIADIGTNHYPTSMGRVYVVNAPMSFRAVWAFLSPLLPPRVLGSFVILGGKEQYLPRLIEEHCDAKDIPDFLGGEDASCDFVRERGPWAEYLPPLAAAEGHSS